MRGIGIPGSTKLLKDSVAPVRVKRVAPTSVMRSLEAFSPVVSRSIATNWSYDPVADGEPLSEVSGICPPC